MKRKPNQPAPRPLRIAMLGHKHIPSREGGVEIVVKELATRMAAAGHSVTCYNRRGHAAAGAADTARLKTYQGVTLKYAATVDKKGLAAFTSSFFAALRCAFGRYDVVHFHAEGPCFWLWIPKLFGKRCIATVHGLDHRRAKWGKIARAIIMGGEKCAVRHADEIIVLTRADQAYFRDTYGRDTRLIPNGVERVTPCPVNEIRTLWGLEGNDYLLYLSRVVPEKGLRYLITAFRGIPGDKKLVIAGGADKTQAFMDELRDMAKDDPRIRFVGFVDGERRQELLSNAYLYCLPSDLEGMPLSLMEAMSYGNCCVTSDIPACTEVAGDRAVTFPHGDADALRDVLRALLDDPDRVAAYRRNAAEYICTKYDWDRVTEQTLALYRGEETNENPDGQ